MIPKNVNRKIEHSISLPKIMNLNPPSIYNKVDEFVTLVEEEQIDLVFIPESHERAYPTKMGKSQTLQEIIQIDNFIVINNPHQREGKCGRPALVINSNKFNVKDLTNIDIKIPTGVEIVWASIVSKNVTRNSKIQEIIVGAIYIANPTLTLKLNYWIIFLMCLMSCILRKIKVFTSY